MTRIFVSEFLCGGGREEPGRFSDWAPALLGEAWAMLAAACADFAALPGVRVATVLDERLPPEFVLDPRIEVRRVEPGRSDEAFHQAAGACEYALVIAPEFDGILTERCRMASDAGATLLGPSPQAVALTSDKLALARHWELHGIPTPRTVLETPSFDLPWIVKPRFGAGSHGIRIVRSPEPIPDCMIVQPLVPGVAASVAFLIGPRETRALRPCSQELDEELQYRGGSTPLPDDLEARAIAVARSAIGCVPGLAGYFGVDLVLGAADVAIEINPRLTTSYIGLRQLADGNIADWLLRTVRGEPVEIRWKQSVVKFTANDAEGK